MNLFSSARMMYLGLFVLSLTIFLVHYAISGQAVYGDGIGYYAHVRSWVIDGDWDYTNEYQHIYTPLNNNLVEPKLVDKVQIVATTKDGKAENHYSPGVALLLLPFFLVAHGLSVLLSFLVNDVSTSGYADIYQVLTGIGAIGYVIAGLWLLEQIIRKIVSDVEIGRLVVSAIFLATQLLYYGSFDVLNSHFASFFLATLFFYLYLLGNKSLENIFLLGLVGGLLAVNRLQDGILAILWIIFEILTMRAVTIKIILIRTIIFFTGFVLALWPLLRHWHTTFNTVVEHTYVKNLVRDTAASSPDMLGSFFHPVTGLFTKAPMLLIAMGYFIYLAKRQRTHELMLPFIFFVIQVIIITIQGGWYAAAYGGRMYISSLVFFAMVLGHLLYRLKAVDKRSPYWFVGSFTALNFLSMAYFVFIQK